MYVDRIFGIFIEWPYLALIPAVGFAFMFVRSRKFVVLLTALAWLAYFPYELAMKLRILCSGECNIRIDLLLFYPVLALLSLISIYAFVRTSRRATRA